MTGATLPADDCRDDLADVHPGQSMFFELPACAPGLTPCRMLHVIPPSSSEYVWYCLDAVTVCQWDQAHISLLSHARGYYDYDCSGTLEPIPPRPIDGCGVSPCDGAPCYANSGYRYTGLGVCGLDETFWVCGGGFCTTCSIESVSDRPLACR